MNEISGEPETKETVETKPRKSSAAVIIGLIAVAALAFFGIKQIMYYNMLNEEKEKAAVPIKILTESDFKNSMKLEEEKDEEEADDEADE